MSILPTLIQHSKIHFDIFSFHICHSGSEKPAVILYIFIYLINHLICNHSPILISIPCPTVMPSFLNSTLYTLHPLRLQHPVQGHLSPEAPTSPCWLSHSPCQAVSFTDTLWEKITEKSVSSTKWSFKSRGKVETFSDKQNWESLLPVDLSKRTLN